jgi:hypothetical protein
MRFSACLRRENPAIPSAPRSLGRSQTHISKIPCWTLVSYSSGFLLLQKNHPHCINVRNMDSSHPIVDQTVVPPWLRPGMALSAEWMPMQRFAEVSPICTGELHGVAPTRRCGCVMRSNYVFNLVIVAPSPSRTLSEAISNPV